MVYMGYPPIQPLRGDGEYTMYGEEIYHGYTLSRGPHLGVLRMVHPEGRYPVWIGTP